MSILHDDEFGPVTIRRSRLSRQAKLTVAPSGSLRISLPPYAPLFIAKRLIASSRSQIRDLIAKQPAIIKLEDGARIGKSHIIAVRHGAKPAVRLEKGRIIVHAPDETALYKPALQRELRDVVVKALRKEARSYLPRRLEYLAEQHGFSYSSVRFSHASSRWGSCSTSGAISLNIALMTLDFELIDYVLIHELCHTRQMNHSAAFWQLVAAADPDFKTHRAALKSHSPTIL